MTQTDDPPIETHQTCPDCGHHGCLTVWEDRTFCNSECGFKWTKPMEDKKTTMTRKLEAVVKDVTLPYRDIPISSVQKYGITTGVDKNNEAISRNYPYPHGTKYRVLPKDFSHNAGFKANHLFGMDKFNAGTSKSITVVEGEDDAPSAYFMLGEKFPVVALPGAGISEALLKNCFDYLDSFEQIVVCTDSDDAGERAATKLAATFPNKVYRVSMTNHKDPNEFLKAGDNKDFLFAWHNRKKYVPDFVYNTKDQFSEILKADEINEYIPTNSDELNEKIKGIMRGHLLVLTGPEGYGKTEILRWLEYTLLSDHPKVPFAVLHMEESKKTCLTSYACYALKENLRDPDHSVPSEEVDKAVNGIAGIKEGSLYLFDFGVDEDPLTIVDKVRYFSEVCGCQYVFIDPIQQLAYGKDMTDTEEKTLSQIAVQLERLATELNIGIIMTTHVNDDGQTRSSRMIGKSASVRIDLKRDILNPDKDICNTTTFTISKNRPTSKTGYGGQLIFDEDSFTLREKR